VNESENLKKNELNNKLASELAKEPLNLHSPRSPETLAEIQPNNHPFPFLLYLEWGLLAAAFLSEFLPASLRQWFPRFPIVGFLSLFSFGALGLRLPTGKLSAKIAYVALELGLILLATMSGGIKAGRLAPLLYVILVMRACLMFRHRGRIAVTGGIYILFLTLILPVRQRLQASPLILQEQRPLLINFALLVGLVLLFVLLLVNALLTERQSRQKLAIANDQLRQYALRVENLAMAQERSRIAREIHDSLGHALTGLNLQLEGALKLWQTNPAQARTFLEEAKQLGSTALREVRQSVATTRTDPLQAKSLPEAIAALAADFQRTTGIQPQCEFEVSLPLPPEINAAVYRIVQEALTNTRKYASATSVKIRVEQVRLEAIAPELRLTIQDNGTGFQLSQNQTGFGLQGMRERAIGLGGHLEIRTAPGQGCQITAQFPLGLQA
jgi:signal transduction histidine kinase